MFVGKSIESVINQTYKNIELIIIDDGSTDDSVKVIKDTIGNTNVAILIQQKNVGLCKTLNNGILLSRGKYICFLASDDFYCLDKIETQVNFLENTNDDVAGCYGDMFVVDINGCLVRKVVCAPPENNYTQFENKILNNFKCSMQSLCLKKTAIEKIGFFDETLRYEDYDYILRLLRVFRLEYIDAVFFFYRTGNNSALSRQILYNEDDYLKIISKHTKYISKSHVSCCDAFAARYNMLSNSFIHIDDMNRALKYIFKSFKIKMFQKYVYIIIIKLLIKSGSNVVKSLNLKKMG
jgi:alpha-1,3-rhamnosyltransferase